MSSAPPIVQHSSHSCSITSSRDVLIVVLERIPQPHDLDVILATGEALHGQLGEEIGVLFVLTANLKGTPSEGLRERLGLLRQSVNVSCIATVVEPRGFVAAIMHGLIQALRLLPASYPGKTFRTVDEATVWMRKYTRLDRDVVRKHVDELKKDRAPSQSHAAF